MTNFGSGLGLELGSEYESLSRVGKQIAMPAE